MENALIWILVGVVVLLVLYPMVIFNRLVNLRQLVRNAWSNVDTELKRRHELVPNLVEAVKGYAAHERMVLERVIAARNQAMAQHDPSRQHAESENQLSKAVRELFAVAEAYPGLKASEHFLNLQRELVATEDRIQAARRFYNGNVREINTLVEQFPSSLIARGFGFESDSFFEVESSLERAAPVVRLN